MMIDWNHFTPWASLVGGIILGVSAALFVLVNGRITGISGILGGLFSPNTGAQAWRIAYLLGLVAAPCVVSLFVVQAAPRIGANGITLCLAGLLVGVGTRYAGGCTSGHGVCGLARLSPRSLVATLLFMAAGMVTVGLLRHVL